MSGTDASQSSVGGGGARSARYHYRRKAVLGRGAFSTVYQGECVSGPRRGQAVAIKRMDKARLKLDAGLQQVFRSEVAALRALPPHPHLIAMLDYFEDKAHRHVHIVLELCREGTLRQLADPPAPASLPARSLQDVSQQLACGLAHLHAHQYVHRDLKPDNVLLQTASNRPCGYLLKLSDFGFARPLASQDLTATFCGSPMHMAPEVLAGGPYDPTVDLWSLGVIIYRLRYGKYPFAARSVAALKQHHREAFQDDAWTLSLPDGEAPALKSLLRGLLALRAPQRLGFESAFAHPYLAQALLPASPAHAPARQAGATPTAPGPAGSVQAAPVAQPSPERTRAAARDPSDYAYIDASLARNEQALVEGVARLGDPGLRGEASAEELARQLEMETELCEALDAADAVAVLATQREADAAAAAVLLAEALRVLKASGAAAPARLRALNGPLQATLTLQLLRHTTTAAAVAQAWHARRAQDFERSHRSPLPGPRAAASALVAAVEAELAGARRLARSFAAPTESQWRLRESRLEAVRLLLAVAQQVPGDPAPEALARLAAQAQALRAQGRPTACVSSPRAIHGARAGKEPNLETAGELGGSPASAPAFFCGRCGERFPTDALQHCQQCGTQRSMLRSAGPQSATGSLADCLPHFASLP